MAPLERKLGEPLSLIHCEIVGLNAVAGYSGPLLHEVKCLSVCTYICSHMSSLVLLTLLTAYYGMNDLVDALSSDT